jgi:EAL and modified HD-GYP domain-containing signal transduction protein
MFKALLGWLFGTRRTALRPSPSEAESLHRLNREAPLRTPGSAGDEGATTTDSAAFLCREAVLGRNQRIAGYQFMLREGARARIRHNSRNIHHVYAEVLVRSLMNANIGELLGERLAFIDLPDSFLSHRSLAGLPARNVVIVPTVLPAPDAPAPASLSATVAALRARGLRFALPDPTVDTELAHLLPQAEFIVARAEGMDARRGLRLSNIALEVARNARLIVRGLPSADEFRFAYTLGASLFQGPFVTRREDWSDRQPGPSTARVGALIARLRAEADTREIAALLKQDAALSLRLLRYINSTANALPQPVSSIEHALTLLGRDKLHRWLILLVCSVERSEGRGSAALETALVRGRLMELLGAGRPVAERDALFLVGLLSLVDVIMQVPLDKALALLALNPAIEATLRGGNSPYQALLALAVACERGERDDVRTAAASCDINPEQASECHLQALSWAMQIQD